MGVVNRGSSRLKLNALARELFWFGLEAKITLTVEWVPREENTLTDELSKMLIPDDFTISRTHFEMLERRFGAHSIDLSASSANNLRNRFYSLHWCMGSGGVNAFAITGVGSPLGYTAPAGLGAGSGESWKTTDRSQQC